MSTPVVLHDYWRSSASYRVRIALNLCGLSYERRVVDLLAGEQTAEAYMARNPQGLVPTLEIDGHTFTQSLAIIEYLDESRQIGFLPKDSVGRQRVRALAHAIAIDIHPVCNLRVAKYAVGLGGSASIEIWMQHFITLGLAGFEGLLAEGGDGQFCHGDTITLADICIVPQIYNANRWKVDLTAFPITSTIARRLELLAPFVAAHPDYNKIVP
jgi:maleylacetoacetate isomerase